MCVCIFYRYYIITYCGKIISDSNRTLPLSFSLSGSLEYIHDKYIFLERCVASRHERLFRNPSEADPRWPMKPESERVEWPLENRYSWYSAERMKMTERESRALATPITNDRASRTMNESLVRFAFSVQNVLPHRAVKVTGSGRARRSLGRIFVNWCKQYTVNGENARRKSRLPCVPTYSEFRIN